MLLRGAAARHRSLLSLFDAILPLPLHNPVSPAKAQRVAVSRPFPSFRVPQFECLVRYYSS